MVKTPIEVAQRHVRRRALARLGEMADCGDFDEFLGDKAAYRRETAEIKADPAAVRALAEARESVREGDVVYGADAARDLLDRSSA